MYFHNLFQLLSHYIANEASRNFARTFAQSFDTFCESLLFSINFSIFQFPICSWSTSRTTFEVLFFAFVPRIWQTPLPLSTVLNAGNRSERGREFSKVVPRRENNRFFRKEEHRGKGTLYSSRACLVGACTARRARKQEEIFLAGCIVCASGHEHRFSREWHLGYIGTDVR